MMSNSSKGFLIGLAGYSFYTFSDTIMKSLSQDYPLPLRMMIAYLVAASFIATITLVMKKNFSALKPNHLPKHLIRAMIVLIAQGSCFLAFAQIPLANTYAILYLVPICVALMAGPFLKEWPSKMQIGAIIIGWIGALIIIRPGQSDMSIGYLYALCGMAFISANQIYVRKFGQTETATGFTFSAQILIGLVMIPFAIPYMDLLNLHDTILLILMGLFIGIAMLLVTKATIIAPAGRAAPSIYIQILWGMLFGALFFSDTPEPYILMGALLVIISGIVILIDKYRPKT